MRTLEEKEERIEAALRATKYLLDDLSKQEQTKSTKAALVTITLLDDVIKDQQDELNLLRTEHPKKNTTIPSFLVLASLVFIFISAFTPYFTGVMPVNAFGVAGLAFALYYGLMAAFIGWKHVNLRGLK